MKREIKEKKLEKPIGTDKRSSQDVG